jgi:hypothetical protein
VGEPEAKPRCDYGPSGKRRQRFTDEFLIREWAIDLSSIEKCYAQVDRRPDYRDHLILLAGRTVTEAHTHAAKAEG